MPNELVSSMWLCICFCGLNIYIIYICMLILIIQTNVYHLPLTIQIRVHWIFFKPWILGGQDTKIVNQHALTFTNETRLSTATSY